MMPTLQLGPLAIPVPAFTVLIGIWLGLSLAERHAERFSIRPDLIFNLALTALVGGVVAGRLTYVARYPYAFSGHPLDIFSRNLGLFDPAGGLIFGILAAWVYTQRKKMSFWSTLDALTPALAVLAVAIGAAHLASGGAYGAPADLPWAVEWLGARRHPWQVYEILAAVLLLAYLWPGRKAYSLPGEYFLTFIACSAGIRLFLEAFRGDSSIVQWGLRAGQVAAWLVLALSWSLIVLRSPKTSLVATQGTGVKKNGA